MGDPRYAQGCRSQPAQPDGSQEKRRADVCRGHHPRPRPLHHQPARGRAPGPRVARLRRRRRRHAHPQLQGALLSRPPSSRWYRIAAILIFLAGLVDFSLYVAKRLDHLVGSLIEVTVPSAFELTFTEPGPYTIFMEWGQTTAKLNVRLVSKKTGA